MRDARSHRASALVHAVLARRHSPPTAGLPMTWASALDRFARSVHRYHDRVDVIPDRALRRQLQEIGEQLNRSLATARGTGGARGGRVSPGPDGVQAVRDVLRAGSVCSRAIEAALGAAAARRAGETEAATHAVRTARALADLVAALVEGRAA